jgi:hypothetical protein
MLKSSILRRILLFFVSFFFERKYLSGRFFESSMGGFIWAINSIWTRNILRLAPPCPWPAHMSCTIINPKNIIFDPNDLNNFQSRGTYFQCPQAKIYIGQGSYIGPNVGLITSNHDMSQPQNHLPGEDIVLGKGCWIGMNSVVLPGVILGDGTVVAAGSVVTKRFPEGSLLIGGAPARIIRSIERVEP